MFNISHYHFSVHFLLSIFTFLIAGGYHIFLVFSGLVHLVKWYPLLCTSFEKTLFTLIQWKVTGCATFIYYSQTSYVFLFRFCLFKRQYLSYYHYYFVKSEDSHDGKP